MSVIKKFDARISNKHPKYGIMVESYNSAMEVVDDCRKRKRTNTQFYNMETKSLGSWYGVDTYDEALEYLHNGYQPVVDDLKSIIKAKVSGAGKRMTFKNNIVGYSPVVPLALKGVPNCMVDTQMKPIKTKVIDIYYEMSCNCGYDSDDIINAGKKLLGAIMELERQGYKFNLYSVQAYADDKDIDILTVKIKSSNQPLDLKRISFPTTHTAFFRVIGFDWYSKTPKGRYRSCYGHSPTAEFNKEELRTFVDKIWGKNAVFLDVTLIIKNGEEHIKEVLLNETKNRK